MLGHTQVQCFQTQVQQECVLWRLDTAQVAHQLGCSLGDVSHFAEGFRISQSVVRLVRCAQSGEFVGVCIPIEVTAVYNDSTYAGGMSVHVFGGRVYYDVGTPFKRTAVDGGREGVVHNQGHAVAVGNAGKLLYIEHFERRVGDGFAE